MFENFAKPTKEIWVEALKKELKGADFESSLIKYDPIEGIKYPSFFHQDDVSLRNELPGKYPYRRGFYASLSDIGANDWSVVSQIEVTDEKKSNQRALDELMRGATALCFNIGYLDIPDIDSLLKGLDFRYIKVYFRTQKPGHLSIIKAYFEDREYDELFCSFDPLSLRNELQREDLLETKGRVVRNFEIDAYTIQQAGANCIEELTFAMLMGHAYILEQMKLGRSIDDALARIHFTFGVGANYLFEISKFRAFRMLWAKIARSYEPVHRCNETVSVTAKIGFLNKSLNDPYTNLLRQTTEVMSAVLGGANHVLNQAYDALTTSGASDFATRMATNISLILKEESYLNQVLDAVGGSYALEQLTETLAEEAWNLFREMDAKEGLVPLDLLEKIKQTASQRIDLYRNRQKTLIGVNKFMDQHDGDLKWNIENREYFGLKPVVIENSI